MNKQLSGGTLTSHFSVLFWSVSIFSERLGTLDTSQISLRPSISNRIESSASCIEPLHHLKTSSQLSLIRWLFQGTYEVKVNREQWNNGLQAVWLSKCHLKRPTCTHVVTTVVTHQVIIPVYLWGESKQSSERIIAWSASSLALTFSPLHLPLVTEHPLVSTCLYKCLSTVWSFGNLKSLEKSEIIQLV